MAYFEGGAVGSRNTVLVPLVSLFLQMYVYTFRNGEHHLHYELVDILGRMQYACTVHAYAGGIMYVYSMGILHVCNRMHICKQNTCRICAICISVITCAQHACIIMHNKHFTALFIFVTFILQHVTKRCNDY